MVVSSDLLLGLILGAMLVLLLQQGIKLSNRLMSPGCLMPIALVVVIFVVLILTGVVDFQLFR